MVMKLLARTGPLARAAVVAICCAAVLAGCGTAKAPGGGSSGTGSAGHSGASQSKIALTFTLANVPGHAPTSWTLRCDPPGGSHPDRAAAECAALLHMKHTKNPFAPLPKRKNCPMIMVSDKTITVTGRWFGQRVHRVIMDGTCDLGLFNSVNKIIY